MQAGEGEGKEGLPPPEGRARRMDAPPPAPAAGTTSGGPAAPGRAASRAAASEAAARRWGSWGYCHGCRKHVEVAAAAVPAEPGVSPSCPDCHRDFVELLEAPPATTRGGGSWGSSCCLRSWGLRRTGGVGCIRTSVERTTPSRGTIC